MFKNIAGYQFVALTNLPELKAKLLAFCLEQEIKGTILLSLEGINIMLAASAAAIAQFELFLNETRLFAPLTFKYSDSDAQPYQKMRVRLKKEIITMGCPEIKPAEHSAPEIEPAQLKQWLDENREVILIDTRNDYEYQNGSFATALNLNIQRFSQFPAAIEQLDEAIKQKTVVVFCTGGIRCEKAAPYMLQHGYKEVYQLKGGILKYFEQCENAHYAGDCFVFDDRVALNAELEVTGAVICKTCHNAVDKVHHLQCAM